MANLAKISIVIPFDIADSKPSKYQYFGINNFYFRNNDIKAIGIGKKGEAHLDIAPTEDLLVFYEKETS